MVFLIYKERNAFALSNNMNYNMCYIDLRNTFVEKGVICNTYIWLRIDDLYVIHISNRMEGNKVSKSQKEAQKKYDQKTKTVSIKYTPVDMEDYKRLKVYLEKSGKSTNKFVKELINAYFESGKGEIYDSVIEKKLHTTQEYYNFATVNIDNIQPLIDYFGNSLTRQILNVYMSIIKKAIISEREEAEFKLKDWIQNVNKRIEKGDFENKTIGTRYKILKESLYEFLEQ